MNRDQCWPLCVWYSLADWLYTMATQRQSHHIKYKLAYKIFKFSKYSLRVLDIIRSLSFDLNMIKISWISAQVSNIKREFQDFRWFSPTLPVQNYPNCVYVDYHQLSQKAGYELVHFKIYLNIVKIVFPCQKMSSVPAQNLCGWCDSCEAWELEYRHGGCLNIKISSYQYQDPHVKDKKVSWPSYL